MEHITNGSLATTRPDFEALTRPMFEGDSSVIDFRKETVFWTVNGGFLAATALRVAEHVSSKEAPLSISCQFLRTVKPGRAELTSRVLQRTPRTETIEVSIHQRAHCCMIAQIWTGRVGQGVDFDYTVMPVVPHPDEMRSVSEINSDPLPVFWNFVEQKAIHRIRTRAFGFRAARALRWFRYCPTPTFACPYLDLARVAPLIDAMWLPAASAANEIPALRGPAPTMQLTIHFVEHDPGSEWLLVDANTDRARSGLIGGAARVWSIRGKLVATGMMQMLGTPGSAGGQPAHGGST